MSVPLSLRVCCMAVMAPALTEAASQSCIKISPAAPPSSPGLPAIRPVTNGNSNPLPHPSKASREIKSCITIEELKRLQHKGLLKDIGCQEIKFKVIADQENSVNFKNISLLKSSQIVDKTLAVVETMNQGNHVNGNSEIDSISKIEDNCPKLEKTVKEVENNLKENLDVNQTNTDPVEKTYFTDSMVASSSDLVSASCSKDADLDTELPFHSAVDLNLKEEVKKKQHVLERRTEQLLRRLRRLQAKSMERHLHSQVKNFVGFQHKNLQSVAKSIKSTTSSVSGQNDVKADLFSSEDVKSLSTAALVNLVRRLQTSQPSMSISHRYANSRSENVTKGVLTMDKVTADESVCVSGILTSNLHHMQDCFDSEATESSSGGESCDEDTPTYSKKSKTTTLHRRAEWKWASERAAVASRWTWLQAQVSDLEYRIRQQSEIYKQIRNTKGPVVLGEQPSPEDLLWRIRQNRAGQKLSPLEQKIANIERKNEALGSPCNISKVMMNVNRQATNLTQSLGTVSPAQGSSVLAGEKSKHLNGVIGSSHGQKSLMDSPNIGPGGDNDSTPNSSPINHDLSCQASRCRPVRSYRKRKLLRTVGLHTISRKAARLSTVKCQCYPPISSCPMCGGRYNNVQRIDVDCSPLPDRVALLDPAFHPVLSFSQEIPLTIRFESHLKKGDWQNSATNKNSKILSEKRHQRYLVAKEKARKNGTKYNKSAAAALLSSAKLRNKYERRTPTKSRSTPTKKSDRRLYRNDLKKKRTAQIAAKKNRSVSSHDDYRMTPSPMSTDSDFLSSSYPSCSKDSIKKKKVENASAYDINNIVIPYSMAASTRVEKLQYKEIVTPKWRQLGSEDNCDNEHCDEEVEELTDEAFLERHYLSEVQERKRFSNFVQYPSRRSRNSRTDSGAASDVAAQDGQEETFRRRSSSAASIRSASFSLEDKDIDMSDANVIEPWGERAFPLSEEEYNIMLKDQPEVLEPRRRRGSARVSLSESFGGKTEEEGIAGDSVPTSPLGSTSSPSVTGDDPNDPEWSLEVGEAVTSKSKK